MYTRVLNFKIFEGIRAARCVSTSLCDAWSWSKLKYSCNIQQSWCQCRAPWVPLRAPPYSCAFASWRCCCAPSRRCISLLNRCNAPRSRDKVPLGALITTCYLLSMWFDVVCSRPQISGVWAQIAFRTEAGCSMVSRLSTVRFSEHGGYWVKNGSSVSGA